MDKGDISLSGWAHRRPSAAALQSNMVSCQILTLIGLLTSSFMMGHQYSLIYTLSAFKLGLRYLSQIPDFCYGLASFSQHVQCRPWEYKSFPNHV